jgi:hypothetical protein
MMQRASPMGKACVCPMRVWPEGRLWRRPGAVLMRSSGAHVCHARALARTEHALLLANDCAALQGTGHGMSLTPSQHGCAWRHA